MQKVHVTSSFFGGRGLFGVTWLNSRLVVVPFIIGIVMLFVNHESFLPKLITGLGVLIIIASVIASTRLYLERLTLYDWILMLVLIFGGFGFVAKTLFKSPPDNGKKKKKEDAE